MCNLIHQQCPCRFLIKLAYWVINQLIRPWRMLVIEMKLKWTPWIIHWIFQVHLKHWVIENRFFFCCFFSCLRIASKPVPAVPYNITEYQAYCLICKLPLALMDLSLAHAGCILSDPGLPGSQPLPWCNQLGWTCSTL